MAATPDKATICIGCGCNTRTNNDRSGGTQSVQVKIGSARQAHITGSFFPNLVGRTANTSLPSRNPSIHVLCSSFKGEYPCFLAACDTASSIFKALNVLSRGSELNS